MKHDVVIIGGGLAGLTTGIRLQQKGFSTVIVSSGQSALHFFSGSFDGVIPEIADEAVRMFGDFGVRLKKGGWRLTPAGTFRESPLSLEDTAIFPEAHAGKSALIVNFDGYHDFFTSFIAEGLEKNGSSTRVVSLKMKELEHLRTSPSEMRSVNIARVMDGVWMKAAQEIRTMRRKEENVILPHVFGLRDGSVTDRIRELLPGVQFIGTLPPSVPGIRLQMTLRRAYESLGGMFLMGDSVDSAALYEGTVSSITTKNLGTERLFADTFVLASGSYFSKGLSSSPSGVSEPLLGLDTVFEPDRNAWYRKDFFDDQPYMGFGLKTTGDLRAVKDGNPLDNLYVAGSILGATRSDLGTAAGLCLASAIRIADTICTHKEGEEK